MITYERSKKLVYYHGEEPVIVKLEGKFIGTIKKDEDGWCYYPKGQKTGGDAFKTLALCKRSLEEE